MSSVRSGRAIVWKAQMRLCGRFRALELSKKGKRQTIVVAVIARERTAAATEFRLSISWSRLSSCSTEGRP